MLIPAILRKNEILEEFYKLQYTDDMMYESGSCDNYAPDIIDVPDKETYQFAIVNDKNKLIGYVSYKVDWYSSQAYRFGLISFDRGNPLIGRELYHIISSIINDLKLHRIEWFMVGGNPVEKSYDALCNKYHGRKLVLRDTFKDKKGNYRNSVVYEIINEKN